MDQMTPSVHHIGSVVQLGFLSVHLPTTKVGNGPSSATIVTDCGKGQLLDSSRLIGKPLAHPRLILFKEDIGNPYKLTIQTSTLRQASFNIPAFGHLS